MMSKLPHKRGVRRYRDLDLVQYPAVIEEAGTELDDCRRGGDIAVKDRELDRGRAAVPPSKRPSAA